MIEKEMKVILNVEEYERLCETFKWESEFWQSNYYYCDDIGVLEKNRVTVRIRVKNESKVLQIKIPVSEKNGLHIKKEFEENVNAVPDVIGREDIQKFCEYTIGDVKKVGCLKTLRKLYYWNEDTEICLDKNEYLGICDYELEIEFKNGMDKTLLDKIENMEINFDNTIKGKYSRFMKALNKSL